MPFDGFYYDWKWWTGSYSNTREFNWEDPINVFAFGSLSAISMVGAGSQMVPNTSYVGILEETVIDARGDKVTKPTPASPNASFPSPSIVDNNVVGVTFAYGSSWPYTGVARPVGEINYANANFNIFLWS
jgi:hypothetical protein